jgi:hypothetical protein
MLLITSTWARSVAMIAGLGGYDLHGDQCARRIVFVKAESCGTAKITRDTSPTVRPGQFIGKDIRTV